MEDDTGAAAPGFLCIAAAGGRKASRSDRRTAATGGRETGGREGDRQTDSEGGGRD